MRPSILHITTATAWTEALQAGEYTADSLLTEGFIHCSRPDQALRVADLIFRGQTGLVLLVIDPQHLNVEVRWEPGMDDPAEEFPHIYGPINLDAVVAVKDLPPSPDGTFRLPAL
ncbi:MAG: DUF952 domain-containing protein [Chloroflexota bacterium]